MSSSGEWSQAGNLATPEERRNNLFETIPLGHAYNALWRYGLGQQLHSSDLIALQQAADILHYPDPNDSAQPERQSLSLEKVDSNTYMHTIHRVIEKLERESEAQYERRCRTVISSVEDALRAIATFGNVEDPVTLILIEGFVYSACEASRDGNLFKSRGFLIARD